MILKIIDLVDPADYSKTNRSDCATTYIEGDHIQIYKDHRPPSIEIKSGDCIDLKEAEAVIFDASEADGTLFIIQKNKQVVQEILISNKRAKEGRTLIYIMNDNGKTIGNPIGKA